MQPINLRINFACVHGDPFKLLPGEKVNTKMCRLSLENGNSEELYSTLIMMTAAHRGHGHLAGVDGFCFRILSQPDRFSSILPPPPRNQAFSAGSRSKQAQNPKVN